ncbi:MAG: GNAT family N-acetyltransferase [Deltaproteobacteria bacterium]|nr:GNAT family N-acetyltransferase [Deltaproteobacteria bacterium]
MEFPPEELETVRLMLRPPTLEDAESAFQSYASDAKITRYLTWTAHTSPAQTREYFQQAIDAWDLRKGRRRGPRDDRLHGPLPPRRARVRTRKCVLGRRIHARSHETGVPGSVRRRSNRACPGALR